MLLTKYNHFKYIRSGSRIKTGFIKCEFNKPTGTLTPCLRADGIQQIRVLLKLKFSYQI